MDKPMTKQRLEQYRSLTREIELLESKVNVFSNDYVSDTVRSSAFFPYAPHIVSVRAVIPCRVGQGHQVDRPGTGAGHASGLEKDPSGTPKGADTAALAS